MPKKPLATKPQPKTWRDFFMRREPRVKLQDLTILTRQLATLLDSGVPLTVCFDCFKSQREQTHRAMQGVAVKVSSGYRLSNAMRQFPRVFNPIYCGLVESGETSGRLVAVLSKLADDLEKQLYLQKKLVSVLTYPTFLLISAMGCVVFFLVEVLPPLEPMFKATNVPLPWPTQVLLNLKYILPALAGLATVGGAIAYFLYRRAIRNPDWHKRLHYLWLKIPLFGPMYQNLTVTRVLVSLSTMLEVGMPLVPALKACQSLTSNVYLSDQVLQVSKRVIDGDTLTQSLTRLNLFPKAVVHMIAAGEETSEMIGMLKFAAKMLEENAYLALDQLAASLEPLIMILMGLVVGFIVTAAMLPIVELIKNL